jgi:conjugal transfer pilus assembly protein TrbC
MKTLTIIIIFTIFSISIEAQDKALETIIANSKALEENAQNDAAMLLTRFQKPHQQNQGALRDSAPIDAEAKSWQDTSAQKLTVRKTISPAIGQSCSVIKENHDCSKAKASHHYMPQTYKAPKYEALTHKSPKYEILVFVSFSLGNATLKKIYDDARKIGGRLILRGLYKDSFRLTQQKIKELGIVADVDPTLFQKFSIKEVPTFVITEPHQDQQSFRYDQLSGNVTLTYALEKIQETGELKDVGSLLQKLKEGRDA